MKARRVGIVVAVTAGLSTVSLLAGLITNEASAQRRWPGWLEVVRTHPWQALIVLGVALIGLTVLLAVLPEQSSAPPRGRDRADPVVGHGLDVPPSDGPEAAVARFDESNDGGNERPSGSGRGGPRPVAGDALAHLSAELVGRLGRRRTAYPLDLSLAELHRLDLFVPSRLTRYHEGDSWVGERAVAALVAALERGESVLLLGEPGSGKSLSLYGVAIALQRAGRRPIPVRALETEEVVGGADWTALGPASLENAVVLVDGLDEAGDLATSGSLATALRELLQRAPALVTSRTREYEEWIAFETASVSFDEVFVLNGWTVEVEFAAYLDRLRRHGLVSDPALYQTVVASERLAHLVARPLYARMLTFVGQDGAARISDVTNLYGEYLSRLSRATDFAVRGAYPNWTGHAVVVWQETAWQVHSRALAADAIPTADLDPPLSAGGKHGAEARALDQIVDRRTLHGAEVAEFIHYSFYEYLLARYIRDRLLADLSADQAVALLRRDLTREIRHHLVGQLHELADDPLGDRLCGLYQQLRGAPEVDAAYRLTVCNLLVYLVSRVSPTAPRQLAGLLRTERDEFLLNSILWALCHHRSDPALARFFALLEEDPVFRACSRGYVLYYYGDIRTVPPPFLDLPPYVSHERTSSRVLAMFESTTFQAIPAQRRYVDLYTFIDIYLVRQETVDAQTLSVLRSAVAALSGHGLTSRMKARLSEMLHSISHFPVPDTNRHRLCE